MLDIRLRKQLGDFTLDVAFTAESGLTALFGPSGAGKTLIAQMIAGLLPPDEGHVRIGERLLFDSEKKINIPVQRRNIGFVFQEHRLFPHYTVRGNLDYGKGRPRKAGRIPFQRVVDILGIGDLLGRKPASLSGGERQRVAIGRAVLSNPGMLIMDEPLSSLDEGRKSEILPLIEELKSEFNITTLYISHSIGEITRLADTLLLLDKGEMKATGQTADIFSRLYLMPYAGGPEAGTLVEATVADYDRSHHMLILDTPGGGRLYLIGDEKEVGTPMRLRIRASDVAISLKKPAGLSILNRFKGEVADNCAGAPGMEELLLDVGFPLAARITRKSFEEMGLRKGTPVWALVKAVTISRS
ncbi:molybdenum ABC transporter ATP-binding protein [Sneathiella chungangensis]|uniref:Molybdenum ABC transporter ATP-binding protein n=1 Tax=Sneathiella chungangensis TaxID=1418234 RepID=A0A845MCE4_9PROT|nr:molybdenum ABC transporter ATP-binding protein [Sneathiella chungangensis]MZR21362.1 molybdenum ABC transporter ATP-binding protein [Sneathiella chungangensis]